MSEFAKDDNITNSGTDIRETRDDENETLNDIIDSEARIIDGRFVPLFGKTKNAVLEHYLYIVVKDSSLIRYNKNRRCYYVPAAKNLRNDMKAEEMRFVALRVQKRYTKQSFRKWLSDGGEIVLCRKVPDPVNWVNLWHRELDMLEPNNRVGKSRNLFHKMMSNRNPPKIVKNSNSIDFNRDVYFDPRYAFRQKKITDYFKPAAALAE